MVDRAREKERQRRVGVRSVTEGSVYHLLQVIIIILLQNGPRCRWLLLVGRRRSRVRSADAGCHNGNGTIQTTHSDHNFLDRADCSRRGQLQSRSRSVLDGKLGQTFDGFGWRCCCYCCCRICISFWCWCFCWLLFLVPIGGEAPDPYRSGHFQRRHHIVAGILVFSGIVTDCVYHGTSQSCCRSLFCSFCVCCWRGGLLPGTSQHVGTVQAQCRRVQRIVGHGRGLGRVGAHVAIGASRPDSPPLFAVGRLCRRRRWCQQRGRLTGPNGNAALIVQHLLAVQAPIAAHLPKYSCANVLLGLRLSVGFTFHRGQRREMEDGEDNRQRWRKYLYCAPSQLGRISDPQQKEATPTRTLVSSTTSLATRAFTPPLL